MQSAAGRALLQHIFSRWIGLFNRALNHQFGVGTAIKKISHKELVLAFWSLLNWNELQSGLATADGLCFCAVQATMVLAGPAGIDIVLLCVSCFDHHVCISGFGESAEQPCTRGRSFGTKREIAIRLHGVEQSIDEDLGIFRNVDRNLDNHQVEVLVRSREGGPGTLRHFSLQAWLNRIAAVYWALSSAM